MTKVLAKARAAAANRTGSKKLRKLTTTKSSAVKRKVTPPNKPSERLLKAART